VAARAVRIITEVAAVDRPFDYLVTERTERAAVGDRVRVDFNGRSVRGWVTGEASVSADLKPLAKWLGYGPPATLLALLSWAAERWYSPLSRFLLSTSPKRLITELPVAPSANALAAAVLTACQRSNRRLGSRSDDGPPAPRPRGLRSNSRERGFAVGTRAHRSMGRSTAWSTGTTRLRRRVGGRSVGPYACRLARRGRCSRHGARAGSQGLRCRDRRRRRRGLPQHGRADVGRRNDASRALSSRRGPVVVYVERPFAGPVERRRVSLVGRRRRCWPRVTVVDRRQSDPHDGVLARESLDAAHRALEGDEPVAVVVVLQRLGDGRLVACAKCGELARCAVCSQAEEEVAGQLVCRERHDPRANFCRNCGATNLKRLRVGVTTLARDVSAQLAQTVSEVTASSDLEATHERVVVGTEAVWQRVRHCGVVIFVDFDQYLLAPRSSARRSAIIAVGKAVDWSAPGVRVAVRSSCRPDAVRTRSWTPS